MSDVKALAFPGHTSGAALCEEPLCYKVLVLQDGVVIYQANVMNPLYTPPSPTPLDLANDLVAETKEAWLEAHENYSSALAARNALRKD